MENSITEGTGLVLPQTEDEKYQDPTPFPSELPQDMGNPLGDSMTEAYIKPVADQRKAEDKRKVERMDEIYGATKNLDAWETSLTQEQKHRKIINGLIEVKLGYIPEDSMDYARARDEVATKFFDGRGGDSDESLMGEITKQSQSREANEGIHKAMQEEALVGSLDDGSFEEWAKKQEALGGASPQRKQSLLYAYNGYKKQIAEQFGDSHTYAKQAFQKLVNGDIGKALDYIESISAKTTPEEHEQFLGLFREVVLANPSPQVDEIMDEMGIKVAPLRALAGYAMRAGKNNAKAWAAVGDMGGQTLDVIEEVAKGAPTPRSTTDLLAPSGSIIEYSIMPESFKKDKARVRALKNANAFVQDAKRIMRDDYDPIEPHFEGGALGAIESGIYGIPSALATIAAVSIPVVGLPLVGATMTGASRTNYRQRMIQNGVGREEALHIADKLGLAASIPNLLLERLQAQAFIGKVPLMNKAMTGISNRFQSKVTRGIGRFIAANVGETNIEMGQELVEEVVQMMGSAFSEKIPDVVWSNGRDGVFDGYAYKYLETAVTVAPLGIVASIGGIKAEDRAKAFKHIPREIRTMNGIRAVDNDRIDDAETIAEMVEAEQIARANADPNSDEAVAAVDARKEALSNERESIANLQRAGLFPIIKVDKANDGVVEVIHPETGEVLDRIDNSSEGVANSVISYMELSEQADQRQVDELATMVEVAMLDVKEAKGDTAVELEVGNVMDVKGLLEAFPEFANRVQKQVGRLEVLQSKEVLNGGDGGMSRAVYGMNQAVHNNGVTKYVNKIFGNTSGMTVVHERTHSSLKRALDSGATTLQKTFDYMSEIDKSFIGKKDRKGNDIRFLPEGTKADDYVAIDEAVAELSEVLLLQTRNGKKTEMRDAVGRQMAAMVKARRKNAGSFKGFFDAMQEFFGKVLAQSFYMRKAISSGAITEGQLNEFQAMLNGSTAQESFQSDVKAEMRNIQGESMSIGEANYLDLAKNPKENREVLQAMVDAKAEGMGYNPLMKLYHGTKKRFDKFKSDRDPNKLIYFSKDRNMAETYPRGYGGHRNPEADVQKRIDDARQVSRNYTEGAFEKLEAEFGSDIPQSLVDEVFEKEKDIQRDALDGMTVTQAQSTMGIRVIEGYVRADKIFEPSNWREFSTEIMESIGVKSESEIKPQMMRMIEAGSYIVWENTKVVDAVLSKYDAMAIQESSDGDADTIAFRDPSQIKSADPVTYDSDGNVIPLSQRFDAGRDEIGFSIGEVPAEIANSKEPLVEQIYLKETAKFKEGVASGRIKTDADIRDFIGKHMVMHQPDTAMAGEVKVDGESFVKGKGGVYYPVLFSDEGYFWASTAAKADEMAGALNEISERNGGSIYMALTSADVDKLFSSTTMSVGTMNFFKQLTKNPRKYGITENQLNQMLIKASKTQVVKKTLIKDKDKKPILNKKGEKTYNVKTQEFGHKLSKGTNLEQTMTELEGWLQPFSKDKSTGSSFDVRKAFVFDLMRHASTHLNARPAKAEAVAKLLTQESNKYVKGELAKNRLGLAAFSQGLGDLLSEPLTKTFQQFDANKRTGYIYAVIEIEGKVKAIDTDGHESYPKAIVSVDGKLPTVHVMKKGYHWTDVVQEKDSGARIERTGQKMNKVYPTGGFSAYKTRPIQFGEVQEGAEGADLSFSIGDSQMNDTLITNAAMRMRDPEGVTTVMRTITQKIDALRREVPKIISAFGKEVEQHAIVDRKLMGDLRAEAKAMRREGIEAAENAVYEQYGEILSNEDLTALKAQPVTSLVLAEGGMESTSTAKRRKGDDALSLGEYEEAAGLPSLYYGGTQSPDQLAEQLFQEGAISDGDVSTMIRAIEGEIVSVSGRKADLKKAKQMMQKGRKDARTKAQEWLDERISEQERDNNPMARARRALVKLSAIRRSLPIELRGKIEGDAKLLTMGDEARLKYLEETIAKVDKVVDKWIRTETKKAIKESYKIIGKTKLSPATEAEVVDIKRMGEMTAKQVNDELRKHHETIDKETASEADLLVAHEAIATLSTYGNQKDMGSAQLVSLLEALTHIIKTGKTIRAVKEAEKKARNLANQQMTIDVMSGGKGEMTRSERARARAEREKRLSSYKFNKAGAKEFHGKHLAFEGLLNMISRKDKSTGTYESAISKKWQTMVHKATRTMKRMTDSTTTEYTLKMREIFGLKGVKLTNRIHKEFFNTDMEGTGIMIETYEGGSQFISDSIEISKVKQLIAGGIDLKEAGLTQADVDAIIANYNKMVANPKSRLSDTAKVKWDRQAKSEKEELVANQGNAMSLIMMFRQDGIKQSMIKEGYTEEAMAKLEKDFLTDEARQLMEWMSDKYDENYDAVNAVYREQHGVDLPKIEFYAPVKRQVSQDPRELEPDGGGQGFGSTPSMLKNRVTNFAEVDPNTNALRMFQSHMHQSNHYISWSATISELRATFNNMNVQRAMDDYVGVEIRQLINERINWMADGGNRMVKADQWLDKIRMAHTFSSLAYDIGIMIKQWTSLPAYAFDMGARNFAKYEAKFLENPIENAKEMIATEYVQLRFKDGYSRDVAEGLKLEGGNSFQNYMLKGLQSGMMFGKVGDITPVIMGGWAVKKYTYDQARKAGYNKQQAEAQAILAFEMTTDRSQQAVDMKDLSSYSGGGSIAKLFTMYKTSPRQYYAVAWEAVADMKAGRKGATRGAMRKLAITHFILPSVFQFASDSWRKLGDEDEEYEWSDYFRAWALGSLNGLFIAGDLLSPAASKLFGTRVYDANIPVYQAGNAVVRSLSKYNSGDFLEGSHEILKAAGKFTPAKQIELLTYYSILSKQVKNLGGRLID